MRKIIIMTLAVLCMATSVWAGSNKITGEMWSKLRVKDKVALVSDFKAKAAKEKITITQESGYYAQTLDQFFKKNPKLLKEDAAVILKMLIIMDYDWDEPGVDKDALAKQWLGPELYEANRKNLEK